MDGAVGAERASSEQRREAVDAWPLVGALDQVVVDRIGRGVDEFVEDVATMDEPDDTDPLGGSEVLPAPAQRVEGLGEHLVTATPKRCAASPRQ